MNETTSEQKAGSSRGLRINKIAKAWGVCQQSKRSCSLICFVTMFTKAFVTLVSITCAAAHGGVLSYNIAGTEYQGLGDRIYSPLSFILILSLLGSFLTTRRLVSRQFNVSGQPTIQSPMSTVCVEIFLLIFCLCLSKRSQFGLQWPWNYYRPTTHCHRCCWLYRHSILEQPMATHVRPFERLEGRTSTNYITVASAPSWSIWYVFFAKYFWSCTLFVFMVKKRQIATGTVQMPHLLTSIG